MAQKKEDPEPKMDELKESAATAVAETTPKPGGGDRGASRQQLEALRRKLREKFHTS